MERLPIEIQEIIYEKACKLQYDDCLKQINQAHNEYYQRLFSNIEQDKYVLFKQTYDRYHWKKQQEKRRMLVKYITTECWGREWTEVDLSLW